MPAVYHSVPVLATGEGIADRRSVWLFIVQREQGTGSQCLLCNFMSLAFCPHPGVQNAFQQPSSTCVITSGCLMFTGQALLVSNTTAMLSQELKAQWNIPHSTSCIRCKPYRFYFKTSIQYLAVFQMIQCDKPEKKILFH